MYVYLRSEANLWTVGFYDPDGTWHPDSDWCDSEQAARRVHYLNGGQHAHTTWRRQGLRLVEDD